MKTSGERPGSLDENATDRPQLAGVLELVQELTGLVNSESAAMLFKHAFTTLAGVVPFDVGVAVLLEQHLDMFVSSRVDAGKYIGDALVVRVRSVLQNVIPAEFTAMEVVVKDEHQELPASAHPPGLDYDAFAILKLDDRTAGLLLVCRASSPFSDDDRRIIDIFSAQVSMVLANVRAREKILGLAEMDDLTGVSNRRYFKRRLNQEMERARVYNVPLSILLIDVDDFKNINDTFGHVTGDVVLSELCGTVRDMLRSPDGVSRFGGDEFAVLLPHTDLSGATAVADRVLQRARDLAIPSEDGRTISCTVSVGVAQFQESDLHFNDIIRRADAHLYEAKRQGKNRFDV